MSTVVFTKNLQRYLDCPTVTTTGSTVREVLDQSFAGNPRVRGYILDEHGKLRRHVVIFVGECRIEDRDRLSDQVGRDETVYVMQALSGGMNG